MTDKLGAAAVQVAVSSALPTTNVSIDGREVAVGVDPTYAKVQGQPALIKERRSGAVLNTDRQGLQAYHERRRAAREQRQLVERVDSLEHKLDLILAALQNRDNTS